MIVAFLMQSWKPLEGHIWVKTSRLSLWSKKWFILKGNCLLEQSSSSESVSKAKQHPLERAVIKDYSPVIGGCQNTNNFLFR